jgi:hypothetical protein
MRPGRTGNEVLLDTLQAMKAAGIDGTVYTHPIGDHGHGAGPIIGLWDRQQVIEGRGDVPLLPSTWFSIELQATTAVPEWNGQPVRSAQEEDVVLGEDGRISWVLQRQTKYHPRQIDGYVWRRARETASVLTGNHALPILGV